MIGEISERPSFEGMRPPNYVMTEEDKENLTAILEKYDPSDNSKETLQAMREEIRAAGIKPGDDLKNELEAAGFKVGPPRERGIRPTGAAQAPEFVSRFAEKFRAGTATEEDLNVFLNLLLENGYGSSGNIADETV